MFGKRENGAYRNKCKVCTKNALKIKSNDTVVRYMHILMAQVDMMIIELIGNIAAVAYTTRMYMKPKDPEAIELISTS